MSFLSRQTVIAALTANALRPPRGQRSGVPSFAAGWLFGETAPQMLALTALDAATHLTRSRRTGVRAKAGLALAGASALGLAHMVRQSHRAADALDDALVDGLGIDYVGTFHSLIFYVDESIHGQVLQPGTTYYVVLPGLADIAQMADAEAYAAAFHDVCGMPLIVGDTAEELALSELSFTVEETGASYFRAEIVVPAAEMAKLGRAANTLRPGAPV